jgi:arginase family enzyme
MCLAAACGRWEADGWPGTVDPSRVHLLGVRDLDPGEQVEAEAAGLSAEIPDGVPLYVHLDTDVLDPCRIVGVEVTALEDLAAVEMVAEAIAPLLLG